MNLAFDLKVVKRVAFPQRVRSPGALDWSRSHSAEVELAGTSLWRLIDRTPGRSISAADGKAVATDDPNSRRDERAIILRRRRRWGGEER